MDTKMKVVLGIFAVIAFVYVVHFSISYINRRKKESFTDEEDEHFVDSSDSGSKSDASYKFGMKLLKLVDDQAESLSLNKKTKAEVVKELFAKTDELKKLSEADLIMEVEKTAKAMKAKAETFEESGGEITKTPAIPEAEAPKPITGSAQTQEKGAIAPTTAPIGDKSLPVDDDIKTKMGLIKNHLKEIDALVESVSPSEPKKGMMSLPTVPISPVTLSISKPAAQAAPAVKEGFTGFENHVANYASWDY